MTRPVWCWVMPTVHDAGTARSGATGGPLRPVRAHQPHIAPERHRVAAAARLLVAATQVTGQALEGLAGGARLLPVRGAVVAGEQHALQRLGHGRVAEEAEDARVLRLDAGPDARRRVLDERRPIPRPDPEAAHAVHRTTVRRGRLRLRPHAAVYQQPSALLDDQLRAPVVLRVARPVVG